MKTDAKPQITPQSAHALNKLVRAGTWPSAELIEANKKAAKAFGFKLPWSKSDR